MSRTNTSIVCSCVLEEVKQGKVRRGGPRSSFLFPLCWAGLVGAGCCSAAVLQVSGLQDWSLGSLQAPDTTGCTLAGVGLESTPDQSRA